MTVGKITDFDTWVSTDTGFWNLQLWSNANVNELVPFIKSDFKLKTQVDAGSLMTALGNFSKNYKGTMRKIRIRDGKWELIYGTFSPYKTYEGIVVTVDQSGKITHMIKSFHLKKEE